MVDFAGFLVQAVAFVAQVVVAAADENARMVVFSAAFMRFPLRLASISLLAASREHSSSVFSPVEGHATVAGIQRTGDLGFTVFWIADGRALVAARARS